MTILFMGGEMSAFIPSNSEGIETTNAASFSSSFARCAVIGARGTQYVKTPDLTVPDEFYFHMAGYRASGSEATEGPLASFYAGATEVFRIKATTTTLRMAALQAGVLTNIGTGVTWAGSAGPETIDLYIDGNDASGTAKLYLAGTLQETVSAVDLGDVTGITHVRFYGYDTKQHHVSQVIIADEPTIGWRLLTRYPNAAGATSSWTGSYTDVDEIVYSDADFINSATNGQVSTFGQTGPAISGYTVRAVGVYARAKCGASGPVNLQLALRVSGTDYFSASKALDVGYSAYGNIWETNPATAAAWLSAAIDAVQPGVKAIT